MKKYQYIFVILMILPIFLSIGSVSADNETIQFPITEKANLYVDGSITPQVISLANDFDYVQRITFNLIWTETAIDFDHFGTHSAALTNGTLLQYNSSTLFEPIVSLHCFAAIAYDMQINSDDKNPVENHLVTRLSFFKFTPEGLDVRDMALTFTVQDNITAHCTAFFVCVQGYKVISTPDNYQAPPNIFSDIQDFAVEFMKEPLWWIALLIPAAAMVVILKYK